ncbi:YncE family protein [Mycobacterium sp.]|uniref:YncE family protein n=1 Tax=Mycobacterium sp. TaxID=1785 RepID=UPI003F9D1CD2
MSPDRDKDVKKGPIVCEISVDSGPISGIVASPDGSRLMVTNYGGDSVSIIDTDSCRVVETVSGVQEPFAIAAAGPKGPESLAPNRVYVSSVSRAYDAIEVIDVSTNTVVATHPLALSVSDLVVSPEGRYVYASRNGTGSADVAVLDTTTGRVEVIDMAGPGTITQCVRTSPDGGRVYVGTNGPAGGRLVVLGAPSDDRSSGRARWPRKEPARSGNTGLSVTGVVEIGLAVRDVAVSPDGAVAYVASCCPEVGAVVDVVDTRTNKITSTRKLGEISGNLTGCTISRDGDRAYLVSDDGITVLCTLTQDVIGTVAVTEQPSCVVESPDGKRLYVADYSGAVIVTPVASTAPLAIEGAAHRSHASAEWVMPELLQYEPALAL